MQPARCGHDRLLDVVIEDFTTVLPPENEAHRFNLVVCNPPYVRHHHLQPEDKQRLQSLVADKCGIHLSGLSGLYVYFLILAHTWLQTGGIGAWLIPSEFMDVKYGQGLRDYLTSEVTLLEIHRFDPDEVQFDDALVSSAVVWLRNEKPAERHRAVFSQGGNLKQPRHYQEISLADLRVETKWSRFPQNEVRIVDQDALRIKDLFDIKRGVATGANQFFIVDRSHNQLPSQFLTPILPSPRHLETDEILADDDGSPRLAHQLFLLTCDLPETQVKARYPVLWQYLQAGKEQNIHERYLCKQRSPWYSQDKRSPAPFLCTYMGRQSNGETPFRFILNHSRAIAPNVYLNMYPKAPLARLIQEKPEIKVAIWRALRAISPSRLIGEGRVYGGGLYKLEPRELGNLSVTDLFEDNREILAAFPRQPRLF